MAILLKTDKEIVYASASGRVTDSEKIKADELGRILEIKIANLEKSFLKRRLLSKEGIKKDALRIWYEFGKLLNKIGRSYKILGTTDEVYYWQSIYNYVSPLIQRKAPPKKYRDLNKNHFKKCSRLASFRWSVVRKVGTWAEWSDLLDNRLLLNDRRVFKWLVRKIIEKNVGHKEFRPFLHGFRKEMKKYDTKIFSDIELRKVLEKKVTAIDEKKL